LVWSVQFSSVQLRRPVRALKGERTLHTGFLEHGADADGSSELVAGEALVDALVQLDRRVLDVNCADSRQLPDVDASYG